MPPSASSVLILRPGAIGDAIVTLPAVQRLKRLDPPPQVTLVVGGQATPLLRGRCAADVVASYDEPRWAGLFAAELPPELRAYLEDMTQVVFYLGNPQSQVAQRLTCQLPRRFVAWLALPPAEAPVPISLHLQGALGLSPMDEPPRIHLTSDDMAFADAFWDQHGLTDMLVVALHPGSGSPRKNWPAEHYAALGAALAEERQARLLVVTGPADEVALTRLGEAWPGQPPLVVRDASLAHVGALLSRCACLIGNDSGIAHLAAALGTPTVALFGATDPRIWAPQGPAVATISAYGDPRGLEAISVERVLRQALDFLPRLG